MRRDRVRRRSTLFVAIGFAVSFVSVDGAQADAVSQFDREARLAQALGDYAVALAEPERDARLAGFARAERGFASLVDDGVETVALFTNLGNAALQAQAPGRAVLAYHRALVIDPDASTALQNLAHVRSRLPAWVPRPESTDGLRGIFDERRFPPRLRARAAALCFLLGAVCTALTVRRREGAWRGLAVLFGTFWAVLLATLVSSGGSTDRPLAVLVAEEVSARSADSAIAPLALPEPLPAGVEIDLLEERGEWSRVRLANGRDVWVRRSTVVRVKG